jgi:uridine kinase
MSTVSLARATPYVAKAMPDISAAIDLILACSQRAPETESTLVAVSGIDGSGKGYITDMLIAALRARDMSAVAINADGWLNLPEKRFSHDHPAEHFYQHAFRFDEMFSQLILPLKRARSTVLDADLVHETATAYHHHRYELCDIDVVVLEGIFLLKRAYRDCFDLAIWVECSFATALGRALERGQEGLPADETVRAYETIYFPAQRLHFAQDDPRSAADAIVINDDRCGPMRAVHPVHRPTS